MGVQRQIYTSLLLGSLVWQDRQTTVRQCGQPQGSLESYKQIFVWKSGFSSLRHLAYLRRVTYLVPPVLIRLPALQGAAQGFYRSPYPSHHPSALGEFPRCLVASAQLLAGDSLLWATGRTATTGSLRWGVFAIGIQGLKIYIPVDPAFLNEPKELSMNI